MATKVQISVDTKVGTIGLVVISRILQLLRIELGLAVTRENEAGLVLVLA